MPVTVTVTGVRFADASGNPEAGYVAFRPSVRLTDARGTLVQSTEPIIAPVSGGVMVPQTLLATDAANVVQTGWVWQAQEFVSDSGQGTPSRAYSFPLPSTLGASADLAALRPPGSASALITANAMTVTGTPTSGEVLTATAAGAADWQAPAGAAPASTSTQGVVQLAGDLAGTAAAPTLAKIQGTSISVPTGNAFGFLNAQGGWSSADAPVYNVLELGATGNGTTDDTTALQAVIASIATAGTGVMYLPPGTYKTTGVLFNGMSNFAVTGSRAAILQMAGNTAGAPNQGYANIATFVGCTDFAVEGISVDGRRDTLFPIIPLAANASSGQATVQVAHGASSTLVVGQRVSVLGGITVNGGADVNLQDQFLTVQTITPGAGSANDVVTFTGNLANSYHYASGTISDGYGPYAANGAYVTPWQNGNATVAGLTLAAEDQQNGLHLIGCSRFRITDCNIHDVWESPIRCGTHNLAGLAQTQGASYATIAENVLWHGYDQGVGLWCSSNVTVTGNVVTAAGWAGICLTGSDRCTVVGNISGDNVQLIPGGSGGYGVAIEGGLGNTVSGNELNNNYYTAILLTALGTIPFGGPAQLATTIASGSNAVALPATTVNLTSSAGFATAGQATVLTSAGAQQVTYTGVSGNQLTGCTGGVGTMYTGNKVTQYPVFTNNGAVLAVGSASTVVSNGALFQVGGHYSIVDGPRTERITVTAVNSNTITLQYPTAFQHADKCQIGQAVCESNEIIDNSCSGGTDAGIKLASAVRTTVDDNSFYQVGLRGIDGMIWTAGGLQAPYGTIVTNNTITAPDSTGNGAAYSAIAFAQCSGLQISGNRCGGALYTQEYYVSLFLQAVIDSAVTRNVIADTYGVGMRLDVVNEWTCKRVLVAENLILNTGGEGLVLYGGQQLQVVANTLEGCAPNSGPGYGGAMDVRGLQNSVVSGNIVVNNGHGGVSLDNASINGATVYTLGNVFENNISSDDGLNYDCWTSAHQQQGTGIKEVSTGQGPNTFLNNQASGCGTNWSLSSTGNILRGNSGQNPVGKFNGGNFGAQPTVPASGTPYTNILNADATAYITGGTVTGISVGGQATGLTSGSFRVPCGQSITLTYSAAPTWVWFGD